jgi:hypothetical protein
MANIKLLRQWGEYETLIKQSVYYDKSNIEIIEYEYPGCNIIYTVDDQLTDSQYGTIYTLELNKEKVHLDILDIKDKDFTKTEIKKV